MIKADLVAPAFGSGAMFDRIAPRYDCVNRVAVARPRQALAPPRDQRARARPERARARRRDRHRRPRDRDREGVPAEQGDRPRSVRQMLAIARLSSPQPGSPTRVALVARRRPAPAAIASAELDAATIAFGIRNVARSAARAARDRARRAPRRPDRHTRARRAQPRPHGRAARFHTRHVVPGSARCSAARASTATSRPRSPRSHHRPSSRDDASTPGSASSRSCR